MHILSPCLLRLGTFVFAVCWWWFKLWELLSTHSTMVLIKKGTRKAGNRIGDHFIVTTEKERERGSILPTETEQSNWTVTASPRCLGRLITRTRVQRETKGRREEMRGWRQKERTATERNHGNRLKLIKREMPYLGWFLTSIIMILINHDLRSSGGFSKWFILMVLVVIIVEHTPIFQSHECPMSNGENRFGNLYLGL